MKKFLVGFFVAGVLLIAISDMVRTFGQTLPRKGWLGVAAQPVDAEKAKAVGIQSGEGLVLTLVTPNGTFDKAGIKVGDIVLTINDKAINSPAELIAAAQALNQGDRAKIVFISNGTRSTKEVTVEGRLKETSAVAEVNYDAVTSTLGTLRTITYIPKERKPKMPAVFYIQGLPCQTQELGAKDPRKMIFEDWVKAGFVVFRVERPNLGDSIGKKDCRDIDFDEEIEVNNAGYRKLLGYDFVDTENVFFFGHSMGGWTAPFIARMKQPTGIIVYGTGIVSWFEYFINVYRIQSTYGGGTHVDAERTTRQYIPMLYAWLEEGKSAEEMRKDPKLKPLVDQPGMFDGEYFQGRAAGRSARFFYTMSKQNLAEEWSKVTSKVLAMYGEYDIQALNGRDAELVAEVVNQAHPGNGEYMLVPKTEHIFARVDSYKQVSELYGTGQFFQYASENYSPAVGQSTIKWMHAKMKEQREGVRSVFG